MLIAIQYNFVHFSLRTFLKDIHLDVSILPMDKILFLLILLNIMISKKSGNFKVLFYTSPQSNHLIYSLVYVVSFRTARVV